MEQVIGEYPKVMSRIEWKHAQLTTFIANLIRPSKFKVNVQYDTHGYVAVDWLDTPQFLNSVYHKVNQDSQFWIIYLSTPIRE